MTREPDAPGAAPAALRRLLVATYCVGAIGLTAELLLMEHVANFWQQLPVWVIAASLLLLGLQGWRRRRAYVRGFQASLAAVAACGLLGVFLHYDGKAEFKLETDPSLSGWKLIWECLHGPSLPPVLAPGMMVMLGMLGFACTYRHPLLTPVSKPNSTVES